MEHKLEFNYYFSGIGNEVSYSGSVVSVSKCDVEYKCQHLKNCILVRYVVPKLNWSSQLSTEEITQIVISESNTFVEIFSMLLMNPCTLLMFEILIDNTEFEPKYPSQSLGGLEDFLAQQNRFAKSRNFTTTIHKNGWSILEKLVTEFRNRPLSDKNKMALALRWCAKASGEYSKIDKLVSYWISFNSLFEDPNNKEQKAIEKYIYKNIEPLVAKRFCVTYQKQLSVLSMLKIELRNKIKVSDELGNLLNAENQDYLAIMKMMALTIYGVRNKLFHGSYDPQSSQARKDISVAEGLLSQFMKEIVVKEILGYSLSSMPFRLQTKIGIG